MNVSVMYLHNNIVKIAPSLKEMGLWVRGTVRGKEKKRTYKEGKMAL